MVTQVQIDALNQAGLTPDMFKVGGVKQSPEAVADVLIPVMDALNGRNQILKLAQDAEKTLPATTPADLVKAITDISESSRMRMLGIFNAIEDGAGLARTLPTQEKPNAVPRHLLYLDDAALKNVRDVAKKVADRHREKYLPKIQEAIAAAKAGKPAAPSIPTIPIPGLPVGIPIPGLPSIPGLPGTPITEPSAPAPAPPSAPAPSAPTPSTPAPVPPEALPPEIRGDRIPGLPAGGCCVVINQCCPHGLHEHFPGCASICPSACGPRARRAMPAKCTPCLGLMDHAAHDRGCNGCLGKARYAHHCGSACA